MSENTYPWKNPYGRTTEGIVCPECGSTGQVLTFGRGGSGYFKQCEKCLPAQPGKEVEG